MNTPEAVNGSATDDARPRPAAAASTATAALYWVLPCAALLRLLLLTLGPELDTDVFGHAVIGRRFLETPWNLDIHWVWLPLGHVLHAALAWFGLGLQSARLLSFAASLGSIALTARALDATLTPERLALAPPALARVKVTATALYALLPATIREGASAEPEALFTLLVTGALYSWVRRRPVTGALLLSAACLLRYESWLVVPVLIGFAALQSPRGWRLGWALLPLALIGAWCALHWRITGEPLRFLRETREFAQAANVTLGLPFGNPTQRLAQLIRYPLEIPAYQLGPLVITYLIGLPSLVRRGPAPWLAVWAVLLAFLTLGAWQGTHLGLVRHATLLFLPVALATALGLEHLRLRSTAARLLALGAFLLGALGPRYFDELTAELRGWPEASAAAAAVASQPHCRLIGDDPMVELLSGVRWERVARRRFTELDSRAQAALRGECAVVVSAASVPAPAGATPLFLDAHRRVSLLPAVGQR